MSFEPSQSMHALSLLALLMVRMLVALSMLPLFAAGAVPASVRMAFTAGLALCLMPMVLGQGGLPAPTPAGLLLLTVKEALIGAVIGLLGCLVFYALQVAGSIIEMQTGHTMATQIDPLSGHESALVSNLFQQLFSILFVVTGGLLAYIGILFESYAVWPLQLLAPEVHWAKLALLVLGAAAEMLWLAIKIATPFVILLMLAEMATGFLSRMVPQVNAFFLSLPLKVLLLGVLLLAFCTVLSGNPRAVFDANTHFGGVLQQLKGVIHGG